MCITLKVQNIYMYIHNVNGVDFGGSNCYFKVTCDLMMNNDFFRKFFAKSIKLINVHVFYSSGGDEAVLCMYQPFLHTQMDRVNPCCLDMVDVAIYDHDKVEISV